ncbi:MAG: methyltransferase domain-containing protein [Calditrichaeota bacterium]|nr:MAG: methyltransferase domain-containing protein [Calditrichota bacterium]
MDILNELPEEKFNQVDDLLAFVSIYDDQARLEAYRQMLNACRDKLRGQVCLEAGAGAGVFSEWMARMGARKVYAVEVNPLLCRLARERLAHYPNVEVIQADIQNFKPLEPVDVLVHELFGQLLYDEDVLALENLPFQPKTMLPARARLACGCVPASRLVDTTVTPSVLQQLEGVLVSGLFDEEGLALTDTVLTWQPGAVQCSVEKDISHLSGELLYFGLEIWFNGRPICRAGECSNWSYVWTPRAGNRFALRFEPAGRGMQVRFAWLD